MIMYIGATISVSSLFPSFQDSWQHASSLAVCICSREYNTEVRGIELSNDCSYTQWLLCAHTGITPDARGLPRVRVA